MKNIFITILLLIIFKTGFGQTVGQEVLNYSNGCTDPTSENGGVVIKTKYPFNATTYYMPTVIIEGYNYGKNQSVGLIVNWYIYHYGSVPPYFHHKSISSYGAYTPEVYLFNDNGFVSIFLKKSADSQYCLSFRVRSWLRTINDSGADASWYTGWSANTINEAPVTTNNYQKLSYENTFGNVTVTGKVGVGTQYPLTSLTVSGAFTPAYMQMAIKNNNVGDGIGISFNEANDTRKGHIYAQNGNGFILGDETNYGLRVFSGGSEVFTARNNGNIGIGTTSPTGKFEIASPNGSAKFKIGDAAGNSINHLSWNTGAAINVPDQGGANPLIYFRKTDYNNLNNFTDVFQVKSDGSIQAFGQIRGSDMVSTGTNSWVFHTPDDGRKNLLIAPGLGASDGSAGWDWGKGMVLNNDGSVGISADPVPSGYKLAIGGNMIAEKVVVKLKTDWPDFVFKKTYGLRPLDQVEQYINQNSHLPEIPSAEEISKTGIDLGQMNAKLLQKVEELTLYLIEQAKENKTQSSEIKFLKQELMDLKNKK